MGGVTTNFEVLEESLGFSLLPENRDRIADITFEDVTRMAGMIDDHTHADYFAMPTFEDSVGVCNPMGSLGRSLGGYSQHEGRIIDGTSESIVGHIYFSLLTNDRLALPDGLQYVLDYYLDAKTPPVHHDTLMTTARKVLAAYANLGSLFHSGHLLIVPEDIYSQHYRGINDQPCFDDAYYEQLSQSPAIWKSAESIKYTAERQVDHANEYPELDQEDYCRREAAMTLSSTPIAKGLLGALMLAGSQGYRPIVYGKLEQAIMDALIKLRLHKANEVSAGIAIPESSILLPHLGHLPPEEFAALKSSGEAEHVARSIATIEERAAQMLDRPIEMREMVVYELARAAAAVDKTVKSSHVLSEFRKESAKVGIGLIANSATSAAIEPEWLNDPLRMLIFTATSGVASFFGTLMQKHWDGKKTRPVAQAYIKMKDSFVDEGD